MGIGVTGHWVSEQPIPIAGFNLGEYVKTTAKPNNVEVNAYAARGSVSHTSVGRATAPRRRCCRRTRREPSSRCRCRRRCRIREHRTTLAERAAETLTALSQMLGPYPYSSLSLTENPSVESQGWPGLIFLSSYAYLQPTQLRALNLSRGRRHHLQRSDDAARTVASVVRRQGVVGELSRAVAAGGAGELLCAAAAGAFTPSRRAGHDGELSADPGQPHSRWAVAWWRRDR